MKQRLVWRACLEAPPSALLICLVTAASVPQVNIGYAAFRLRSRQKKCIDCVFLLLAGSSGFDGVLPTGPDIAQFKQGVKTVAGKMAVLANGVMNTIQVSAPDSTRYTTNYMAASAISSIVCYIPSSVTGSLWLLLTELL